MRPKSMLHSDTWFPESYHLRAGVILAGKYELVDSIGVGGMGQVWTARNLTTGAMVAAKVLLASHAACDGGLARFRREAHATAQLAHRGIIRVFDLIELDPSHGSLVMVMELLHGQTLARHLEEIGALSVEETMSIILPLLSALGHAHARGIVHRDLKPDNIFLAAEPDGEIAPKLLDFGISKRLGDPAHPITSDGQIVGTLCYMSPEQAMGTLVDARSDIFSIGILLHECLSGVNPFVDQLRSDQMMAILATEPRPIPGVSRALASVVQRAMSPRPEGRFASAAELADALRRAVTWTSDSDATMVAPSSRPAVTLSATRGRAWRALGLAAATVLGLAGAVWLTSAAGEASASTKRSLGAATAVALDHGKRALAKRDRLVTYVPAVESVAPVVEPVVPAPRHRHGVLVKPLARSGVGPGAIALDVVRDPGF